MKLRRCRAVERASWELGDEKHCPFVATDNTFHSDWLYVGVCCVFVCACVRVCLQALCELLIPLIAGWRPAGEPPRTEIKSTLLRYKL